MKTLILSVILGLPLMAQLGQSINPIVAYNPASDQIEVIMPQTISNMWMLAIYYNSWDNPYYLCFVDDYKINLPNHPSFQGWAYIAFYYYDYFNPIPQYIPYIDYQQNGIITFLPTGLISIDPYNGNM